MLILLAHCVSKNQMDSMVVHSMPQDTLLGYFDEFPFGYYNNGEPLAERALHRLVGNWSCTSFDLIDDVWYENQAYWKWEYILGGHAVLNHWWQEDNSPQSPTPTYFANGIFIFNKQNEQWEAVILNSRPHQISPKFQVDTYPDKITMHDGTETWLVTFYDITEHSFNWKYEVPDNNAVWKPISKIVASRIPKPTR